MKTIVRCVLAAMLGMAATPVIAQGPPPHLPASVLAEDIDAARQAHLQANVVADGPVAGGLRFSFPAPFYEGRLFLVGESHGSAAPQVFDIELLRHLNERIGLADYVAEIDPVQAVHFNRFLDSGDEAQLSRVFDLWNTGSQWANVAFEGKLRAMREFNLSLPQARRVRIHGLDAIQDWPLLSQWLDERGAAPEAAAWRAAQGGAARARLAADALARVADSAEDRYLLAALEAIAGGAGREAVIVSNYRHLVTEGALQQRPAQGLWGAFHVLQARVNGAAPFAAQAVAAQLPVAGGVRSLLLLGLDSAVQFPVPLPDGLRRVRFLDGNIDGPTVKVAGSATLRAASQPARMTVFALDTPHSPYRQGDHFIALQTSMGPPFVPEAGRATTDYLQYIGVYRDSDWAAPRAGAGEILLP